MGKGNSKKSAKGRLDKYYKLAKEQGYRARSAFKLIQLNRKYEFLNNAKFCIDLCAAPGGWLQVSSKYMPQGSLILGCDLVPIKPIPRVITFTCDIKTPKCRQLIRSHAKDWLADVVLHDGAPNVGTAWVQDAYSQSDLVLSSLKLATEFLKKGGTFITKVFRSQDYNNLMWVFSQLFGKVEATKPPSSRNVSAEIFVICLNYHAPAHIDPKFLDPNHVFKSIDTLPPVPVLCDPKSETQSVTLNAKLTPNALAVFKPTKKLRHRDGYADDVTTTLFKAGPASQFIRSNGPAAIGFLGEINRIDFETDEEKRWYALPITDDDVKANCADLKVLGKRDFQRLLKWRAALREEIGLDVKKPTAEEFTEAAEVTHLDPAQEEEQLEQELERLTGEDLARRKRERRKNNEKRQKQVIKMQLSMVAPTDIGMETQDLSLQGKDMDNEDVFDIKEAERKRARKVTEDGILAAYDEESSEDEPEPEEEHPVYFDPEEEKEARTRALEAEIDGQYQAYIEKRMQKDPKYRVREKRRQDKERTEVWDGVVEVAKNPDNSDEDDSDDNMDERGWDNVMASKEREDDSDSDESDGGHSSSSYGDHSQRPAKRRKTSPAPSVASLPPLPSKLIRNFDHLEPRPSASKAAQVWFSQDMFKGLDDELESDDDDAGGIEKDGDEELVGDESDDDFEVVPQDEDDATMWDVADENQDEKKAEQIKNYGLLTAEAVALAQKLVNRETTKTQMINDGFTRYSLNDKEGLPSWFLEEEANHYQATLPITKEAVRMLRAKQRALDARPIKKIAEAKARKKMRVLKQIQKASRMAEGVTDNADMNERQKSEAVQKIMRKGIGKGKQQRKRPQVVVAGGLNKGLNARPKGVKGPVRYVDRRGKKDLRAEKRAAKAKKKRKH